MTKKDWAPYRGARCPSLEEENGVGEKAFSSREVDGRNELKYIRIALYSASVPAASESGCICACQLDCSVPVKFRGSGRGKGTGAMESTISQWGSPCSSMHMCFRLLPGSPKYPVPQPPSIPQASHMIIPVRPHTEVELKTPSVSRPIWPSAQQKRC